MSSFDLFSVGHSNIAFERFAAMLEGAGVDAVADVRSAPVSRFIPWFSAKKLAPALDRKRIGYRFYGATLGGRPRYRELYCDGVAVYEAMARCPEFRDGI